MTLEKKMKILKAHGVPFYLDTWAGAQHLIAVEACTKRTSGGDVVSLADYSDVTSWGKAQLMTWLGY